MSHKKDKLKHKTKEKEKEKHKDSKHKHKDSKHKDKSKDKSREKDKEKRKMKDNSAVQDVLGDIYSLEKQVGSGTFGDVYDAIYKPENKHVALKVETKGKKSSMLESEYNIYKKLVKNGVTSGIPAIYEFTTTPKYNILSMELLSKSLDAIFIEYNKQFAINTVITLGYNMVDLLQKIHNAGFIHRDIKPNNFMIGQKGTDLYIMDFGLSKCYLQDNGHIPLKTDRSLVGTARYASQNVHLGLEPSRRDDLESIAYMLIYFCRGTLPWQGLKKRKGEDHIETIGNVKIATSVEKLCKHTPDCLKKFLVYTKSLAYDQTPDYEFMKNIFTEYSNCNNIPMTYQWTSVASP